MRGKDLQLGFRTDPFVYLEFYGCYICVDGIYFVTSHGFELLYKGVRY